MFNPAYTNSPLPVGYTWAKLQSVGRGTLVYDFLLNPQEIVWSHTANLTDVAVLYTSQPQNIYNNSSTSLSIPSVLIYTPGNAGSIRSILSNLEAMTKPVGETLPMLSLSWGNISESRLYMKSISIRTTQYRSGDPTQATASMEFVRVAASPVVSTVSTSLLSLREQREYQNSIKNLLKTDKAVAKRVGISSKDTIVVSPEGVVSTKDKSLGKVSELFPSLYKKSHSGVK